ncbi:hypothetical protein ACSVH2_00780 [Flavobacterium sp. RSB2_4_14]|uniref:hypothetical protein n=1 Tax=Flavobacterium sp. RSB2_4_14 TaxID=3447665 RepID=UPI003F3D50C9
MIKQLVFCLLLFFCSSLGFSQKPKLVHGKIVSEEMALSAIDIVNINSKKITKSASDGSFSIMAKIGDELFIISKEYIDQKIVLTKQQFDQKNLIVKLEKKPIELEDVNVVKAESMKIKVSQADMDQAKLIKQQNTLKVPNVQTGEIENGVDFVRIGKDISKLLKNKDEEKTSNTAPKIGFKEYINSNFDNVFFIEELKIKAEEVNLFISYCEVDATSKSILENQNLLETTEFLLNKNEDFKKPIESNK